MNSPDSWPLILLIEDDQSSADALISRLTKRRFRVWHADTSTKAFNWITKIGNPLPDAIILDLRLPNGDGVTILKQIRSTIEFPIPVVILTGFGTTEAIREATRLDIAGFIRKPLLDVHELLVPLWLGIENAMLLKENSELKERLHGENVCRSKPYQRCNQDGSDTAGDRRDDETVRDQD